MFTLFHSLFSFKENSRNEHSWCVTTKINVCQCKQARNILFFINCLCFPRSPAWCWSQQAPSSMLFLNCVSHPWREYVKTIVDLHTPHVENLRINFGFKFRHRRSLTEFQEKLIAVCNWQFVWCREWCWKLQRHDCLKGKCTELFSFV